MSPAKEGDQQLLDDPLLSDDHFVHLGADAIVRFSQLLDRRDVVRLTARSCTAHLLCSLLWDRLVNLPSESRCAGTRSRGKAACNHRYQTRNVNAPA